MNIGKREADFGSPWGPDQDAIDRRKKRRSRWGGDEKEKTFIPGMPTVIPVGLNKEQEEQYLVQLQIEEISRRLRTGDLGIPANPDDRSSSPEPIYNSEGKRLNTREYRTRKKLEEERHQQIQNLLRLNPEYKPPADYKPPIIRVSDKVMIPQEEHPDINFVGLLIGPRGNTLKNLEKETGAKIIIRGKGSVKEGKIGRKDGQPLPGEDEPLHAYVTANNPENVRKAVDKIKEIIKQGIEVPEGQNDLRRQQLRELALLNGTLRENDGLAKLKQLQQAQTIITNTILCSVCGGTGHIAADCKQKRPGDTFRTMQNQSAADKAKMDSEYMSLMAELGEGPPPPKNDGHHPQPNIASRPHFTLSDGSSHNPLALPPPIQNRPPMGGPPPMAEGPPRCGPGLGPMQLPPPIHCRPPMNGPPPPMNSAPWQQHPGGPMGPGGPGQPKPPNLMGMPGGQPMSSQPSAPISMPGNVPPPHMSMPAGAPPAVTSASMALPPWQQPVSTAPPVSGTTSIGVPPPSNMLPPPPPPPSSQAPPFPWQQPHHHQHQMQGMVPPPPPPVSGNTPPWQQGGMGLAPVPPPPPVPAGALSRWGQPSMPPPPAPVQPPVPGPVAPPPPPPGSQGFNPNAPPPPPPGSEHLGMNMPGIPLGVPPPPPPN